MQLKRTLSGLTLIEIMLSLVIASMILIFLIPQQLQSTHEQLVDKTVAEMNQIVLAARNYYQETRVKSIGVPNSSLWPQALTDLSGNAYLPAAALCSAWPSATTSATCGNRQPYVIFPSNGSGRYDTTVPGIPVSGSNKGGNFWGVSLTLPNAKTAEEVRQKLPFASRCTVNTLKMGTACTSADESTTVTAVVPRPALWPQQVTNRTYYKDGLIQSIGSIDMCGDNGPACGNTTPSISSTIKMPTTCNDGINTTPVLFVYPSFIGTYASGDLSPYNPNFPGISLKTTRDDARNQWLVQAQSADSTKKDSLGVKAFHNISIDYFTVCAPTGDPNKWDPSNFPSISSNGVNW
jgi:type II secretory pathway pseudopilin PulG